MDGTALPFQFECLLFANTQLLNDVSCYCSLHGTNVEDLLKQKGFPEPRLIIFEGFVVAEKRILYKIDDFTILKGMTQLSAAY